MTLWEPEQITSFHVDPSLLLQPNSNTVETAVRPNHLINYSAAQDSSPMNVWSSATWS